MTVRARGFAAIGVWHPKTGMNIGTLWRSASLYECALLFTVERRYRKQASDTCGTPHHVPLQHFSDLDDLMAHLPWSTPLIGVEMCSSAVPLAAFTHPVRGAYLLGAEDHGLPPAVLERCHMLVQVETASPVSMNVACAGSVVLRDRYLKLQEGVQAE